MQAGEQVQLKAQQATEAVKDATGMNKWTQMVHLNNHHRILMI